MGKVVKSILGKIKHNLKKSIISIDHFKELRVQLRTIVEGANDFIESNNIRPNLRLLWGPSFNIEYYSIIHNTLLGVALKLRGVKIIPVSCKAVQYKECVVFGGEYGDYGEPNFEKMRKEQCELCMSRDTELWQKINNEQLLNLTEYISQEERQSIIKNVSGLKDDEVFKYCYDDIDFGEMSKEITLNNYLLGTLDPLEIKGETGRNQIISALILYNCYKKLLDAVSPDRIIVSGGDYYQFSLLRILGNRKNLSCYHYNYAGREGTWTYARNYAPNDMTFDAAWKTWKNLKLSNKQEKRLDEYLQSRRTNSHKEVLAYKYKYFGDKFDLRNVWKNYDPKKPLVLLAANLVWDAASLNKDYVFRDMFDWINEVIKFFSSRPQYQLIIKPHPAEAHPKILATKQTVIGEIEKSEITTTPNIFLLDSHTDVSAYDLYPLCDLGLVHTSTVGIELAIEGKPVVLAANASYKNAGFAKVVENREEYFNLIEKILRGEVAAESDLVEKMSKNYLYFYHFHYMINHHLSSYKWGKIPKLDVKSFEELLPGRNIHLDFVCDSIINDLPIVSEHRWPPES